MLYRSIAIDRGHNCRPDIGAYGGLEDKITMEVGDKVTEYLERFGITVFNVNPSRCSTVGNSLQSRVFTANKLNASLYVSIHCNATSNAKAKGSEVFYFVGNQRTKELSELLSSALSDVLDTNNRGGKSTDIYYVLRHTNMDAILIEIGFLTNDSERNLILKKKDEIAETIATVLLDYCFSVELTKKEVKAGFLPDHLPLEHTEENEELDYSIFGEPTSEDKGE